VTKSRSEYTVKMMLLAGEWPVVDRYNLPVVSRATISCYLVTFVRLDATNHSVNVR